MGALLSVPFWHAPALVHWGGQGLTQALPPCRNKVPMTSRCGDSTRRIDTSVLRSE